MKLTQSTNRDRIQIHADRARNRHEARFHAEHELRSIDKFKQSTRSFRGSPSVHAATPRHPLPPHHHHHSHHAPPPPHTLTVRDHAASVERRAERAAATPCARTRRPSSGSPSAPLPRHAVRAHAPSAARRAERASRSAFLSAMNLRTILTMGPFLAVSGCRALPSARAFVRERLGGAACGRGVGSGLKERRTTSSTRRRRAPGRSRG